MEWIKTVLNAVRAAVDGVSARVDRLNAWAKTFAWVPAMSVKDDIILENQTLTIEDTGAIFTSPVPAIGVNYVVIIDGKVYKSTAKRFDNDGETLIYIGDYILNPSGTLPFVFAWGDGQAVFLYDLSQSSKDTFTVSVTGRRVKADKLPEDFIPDRILNAAKDPAVKTNPVFTGSFSQNRKTGSEIGEYSHAEGYDTTASGETAHAEGKETTASNPCDHAEGRGTVANGGSCHAEGAYSTASYSTAHAEGAYSKATHEAAHAEGHGTEASGRYSHAEGCQTKANAESSHSEGYNSRASGKYSHTEGFSSYSVGESSHAEGSGAWANGVASHAEGAGTDIYGEGAHAQGRYNIRDTAEKYAHIVGNGTSGSKRSNAHTLDWAGVPWFQGRPQFGGTAQDDGSQSVVANGDTKITIKSSVAGSTKTFDLSVDDNGVLPESFYAPAVPIPVTQAKYDAMLEAGKIDENRFYFIVEKEGDSI